jgi:cell division protein FtsX
LELTPKALLKSMRKLCERYETSLLLDDNDFDVFLKVNASDPDIDLVRQLLEASPAVDDYKYLDKQDAYREFKKVFRDKPGLIKNIRPSSLPVSFRVWLTPGTDSSALEASIREVFGVDDIVRPYVFPEGVAEYCQGLPASGGTLLS